MPAIKTNDKKTYVEVTVRLLSIGHSTVDVHKALIALATKLGKLPPTYRQTLAVVQSARAQMREDVNLTREEMQSLVWRSLWDMHKDKSNGGDVRLGALKEISRLYGLYAPTRMHHHVTQGIPLNVILEEAGGPVGIAEVVDGTLLDLDAYAALPAPAETLEAEGADDGGHESGEAAGEEIGEEGPGEAAGVPFPSAED